MDKTTYAKKERRSTRVIGYISVIGWLLAVYSLFHLPVIDDFWSFALLIIFLFITELYPIPVWKSITSLSFPLIYTIIILYGNWMGVLVLFFVSLSVNLIKKRQLLLVWFNPGQLAVALVMTKLVTDTILSLSNWVQPGETNYYYIHLIMFTLFFYLINNLLIDLILWLRPRKYLAKDWKRKMIQETIIVIISMSYLLLMFALGSQNRGGVIDVFSYLFFFSPLVGSSIISAVISRVNREKNRFKALVSLTKELNRTLPSPEWASAVERRIDEFIHSDATLFLVREAEGWKVIVKKGGIIKGVEEAFNQQWFHELEELVYLNRNDFPEELAAHLYPSIRSVVINPLKIEDEMVGVLVVGKENNQLYQTTDIQFLSTLGNQLAVIIKTRNLFSEREQRIVLEERNRIAREIHDGIAQSLAGAVMKLESSKRMLDGDEQKSMLVDESILKLRGSLGEVRESIYALRPTPSDKFGVVEAIRAKSEDVSRNCGIPISIKVRGDVKEIPPHIEKNIYEVVSEALQNAGKHSYATGVQVTIRFCKTQMIVRIKDDGNGFELYEALLKAKTEAHYGILNMNELTEQIDASLKINSNPGSGTEIFMFVPIPQKAEEIHYD